jgi:hypothetical protein
MLLSAMKSKRSMRFPIAWLLAGGAAACGSSTTGANQPAADAGASRIGSCPVGTPKDDAVQALSNNSAELVGAMFGEATDPNDTLRKVIRADLLQPDERLTLGPVHAMQTGGTGTYVNVAFPVTNASSTNLCFVKLDGFRMKDAAGTTLVQPEFPPFLDGSVLAVDSSLWTSTCLLPGETGWIIDIESNDAVTDLYGSLDAIEFRFGADAFPSDAIPPPRVLPDLYGLAADRTVTVCFTNLGTGPAEMTAQSFSRYLALDDAGEPLDWDFLSEHIQPIGLLEPIQIGSASTQYPSFFPGTSHRMRVFIDFDSPGSMSRLPAHATGPLEAWRTWREGLGQRMQARHASAPR